MTRFGADPPGTGRAGLVAAVRSALDSDVPAGERVVLALSGGPDSTALAYLAAEARPDLTLVAAHVRHGLRDDRADAEIAARHARALGLRRREIAVEVDPRAGGVEAAARRARYAALTRVAREEGVRFLLVGHTADDQAETVLLNIARGSGLRGLTGMAPARPLEELRIVRPLLRLRRADVRGFVAAEGLVVADDPTNRDPEQRRARVRRLLPDLGGLAGGEGDPVGALTRLADLARVDAEALDAIAAGHAARLVRRWGPCRAVSRDALDRLPQALSTRVVRLMLERVRGRLEGLDAAAVRSVMELQPGQALHVPGAAWVTFGGGWLAAAPPDAPRLEERRVRVPGRTALDELRLVLHADQPALPAPPDPPLAEPPPGGAAPVWAMLPEAPAPLVVRARRPGDRIRLKAGTRSLQDVLVDAGVPRAIRDLVPVVVRAEDVLWVPGVVLAPSEPAAVRLWLAPAA